MIYLVRHGQTNWNKEGRVQGIEDVPLNLDGIYQAKEKSKLFNDHHFTKVLSSPLSRASTTAKLLTNKSKVDSFEIDDRLIEYDFGSNDGQEISEYNKHPEARDEEDTETFQKRILEALIDAAQIEGNVLLVSHGAVIATLIRMMLPEELRDQWFNLINCSVTAVEPEFLDNGNLALNLIGINMEDSEVEELLKKYD